MDIISKDQFIYEKQIISNLLKDTRLLEITYTDAFHLLFYKTINVSKTDSNEWITEKWMLNIDTSFWVGKRKNWEELIANENGIIGMEDRVVASELVNMKYWNFIEVEGVEFSEKYMHILMEGENILSIAYDLQIDTEYSFCLEEYSDKMEHEKKCVFCEGIRLTAVNFPSMI